MIYGKISDTPSDRATLSSDLVSLREERALDELGSYRLYQGKTPVGAVIEDVSVYEILLWNENLYVFYNYQHTIGNRKVPLLRWEKETEQEDCVFVVKVRDKGEIRDMVVCARSISAAKLEVNKIINAAAVIVEVAASEAIKLEMQEARALEIEEDLA